MSRETVHSSSPSPSTEYEGSRGTVAQSIMYLQTMRSRIYPSVFASLVSQHLLFLSPGHHVKRFSKSGEPVHNDAVEFGKIANVKGF